MASFTDWIEPFSVRSVFALPRSAYRKVTVGVSEGAGAAAVLDSIRPARPTARSEAITTKPDTKARYRPLRTGLEFDAAVRSAGVCVDSLLIVWASRSRDLRET